MLGNRIPIFYERIVAFMPEITYRESLDQKRLETIRQMLKPLPRSCADFIRSLLSTTSTLTRLAYTIDLGTFFDFATRELTSFPSEIASEWTDQDIARLTPRDIEIYADYLSLYYKQTGENTADQRMLKNHTFGVMRKLSSLRSYFNYLFRTQRIPANIATLVPLPKKHEKPIMLLERDEMQKLLEAVSSGEQLSPRQAAFHKLTRARDFAIVMLFLGTGIRVSECVGIDLEDLDFRSNALLVTRKGGNQSILYFPDEVADVLKAYIAERESVEPAQGHEHALFLSLQKRRITQRAVEQMVKKYAMLVVPLKRRMSPHKLRSTYATNLYQETEDIYLVAEALGHADVNTTRKHYASMSDHRLRQAAANTHLPGVSAQEPLAIAPDTGKKASTLVNAAAAERAEAQTAPPAPYIALESEQNNME
jgi:integrase/recombinase XerC